MARSAKPAETRVTETEVHAAMLSLVAAAIRLGGDKGADMLTEAAEAMRKRAQERP